MTNICSCGICSRAEAVMCNVLTLNLMQGNNKEETRELSDIRNYHINHHYSILVEKGENI